MPILQLIFEYFKNQADPKEAIEKACPNAGLAALKIKSYKQNICHVQSYNMMCHMPKLQVICDPSKNRADAKEDTEKASSNLWLTAFDVQRYMASNLSYPELQFDVQHAYIRVICESSKNRADAKEDTAIIAPNAGMAASKKKSYSPNVPL